MYKMHLAKEKQLQQTANKFKLLDDKFYGFFWAPQKYERKIMSEFRENFSSIDIERQKHKIIPPTFFESTDFVWVN